jgi:hypothetical protein
MQTVIANEMMKRSELLADALDETIAELRLIDAADMIGYIRTGQWANIADLVQSSAELSFEDGTLSFSDSGDFSVGWGEAPSISLDMEFQTSDLSAFFTLTIGPSDSAVRMKDVLFASTHDDQAMATHVFASSLAAARRATRPGRYEAARR